MPEEKDYLMISCLIDHLQNIRDNEIPKAAESLAMFLGQKEEILNYGAPVCIQYTRGVGNFAQNLSKSEINCAVLFDSDEAFEFTSELNEGKTLDSLYLIEDTLPTSEFSFPACPNVEGWKVVILEDIVPSVGGDVELTKLLRSISSTMTDGAFLVIRTADMKKNEAWNKEYNDNVVTESFEKKALRKYQRTITSHGSVNVRHTEVLNSFANSDLHSCAREANFRPTREMGLDPSIWCCYEKVS
jgi:hypothetical protein